MKRFKSSQVCLAFVLLILSVFITTGCGSNNQTGHWLGTEISMPPEPPPVTPPDTTRPTVVSTIPVDVATGVCVNQLLTATFNEAMLASTITATGTFTVRETISSAVVPGVVTYDAATLTATFTPTVFFTAGLNYTATITTAATDLAGNALAVDKVWTFTAGATVCTPPPAGSCGAGALPLGSAASFGVLAGTALTITNPTSVIGDVGSPSITPASGPSTLVGTMYDTSTGSLTLIANAVTDMETGISCATGRTCDFNYGAATDFAALPQPLSPGVHCVDAAMSVGSNLTLTTPGVYIFRSTGALTTADTITVAFGGTANAANTSVFWVSSGAASGASIGATNVFLGTIMVGLPGAATLGANTTLLGGRVLSSSAVTLDTNTIAIPIP
ncbi:MAG: Ig-like domain-containing protein [Smithellaceae bacterium]